jgi:hypothetical protein
MRVAFLFSADDLSQTLLLEAKRPPNSFRFNFD